MLPSLCKSTLPSVESVIEAWTLSSISLQEKGPKLKFCVLFTDGFTKELNNEEFYKADRIRKNQVKNNLGISASETEFR